LMSCMKIAIGSEVSDRKKYYMGKFKQSQWYTYKHILFREIRLI
jgi:hypothetical protein